MCHIISSEWIEVDNATMDLITNLPLPTYVKDIRSFPRHTDLYHRFVKDVSKVAKPLSSLLAKDMPLHLSKECELAFTNLMEALTTTLILHPLIWGESFELMCDASDYKIGVVLGRRIDKKPHIICYARRALKEVQVNYTITENEFLTVVFGFKKFRPYLIASHVIVFTSNAVLKHSYWK